LAILVTLFYALEEYFGTPIFEIDHAPYRFAFTQAAGTLAATQAQLKRLSLDFARAKDLRNSTSISQVTIALSFGRTVVISPRL